MLPADYAVWQSEALEVMKCMKKNQVTHRTAGSEVKKELRHCQQGEQALGVETGPCAGLEGGNERVLTRPIGEICNRGDRVGRTGSEPDASGPGTGFSLRKGAWSHEHARPERIEHLPDVSRLVAAFNQFI